MGGRTERSTLSISASLSVAEGFSWSAAVPLTAILETGDLPPRFFLTHHACNHILDQAERHGQHLPEHLRTALHHAASTHSNHASDDVAAVDRR
jgi:hypothetical protein